MIFADVVEVNLSRSLSAFYNLNKTKAELRLVLPFVLVKA
jgi:hypothetical protein